VCALVLLAISFCVRCLLYSLSLLSYYYAHNTLVLYTLKCLYTMHVTTYKNGQSQQHLSFLLLLLFDILLVLCLKSPKSRYWSETG
jgi:hypothetical protein